MKETAKKAARAMRAMYGRSEVGLGAAKGDALACRFWRGSASEEQYDFERQVNRPWWLRSWTFWHSESSVVVMGEM